MKALIAFSARHAGAVLVLTLLLVVAGIWCLLDLPQDALPDWSDRQVIVLTAFDHPPQLIQDRITRPISLALQSVPGVTNVRGSSEYGVSRIYATLADDISLDTVRSQIADVLQQLRPQLPEDVSPRLGPNANPTGWIYQYALLDRTGALGPAELHDLQNWTIRPELQKTAGIAEIATVGGFTGQFQVIVDPQKLSDLSISFDSVVMAIKQANQEVLARTLDFGGQQFMLRSPGLLTSIQDLQNIVLASPQVSMEARMEHVVNRPVLLGSVAHIQRGPDTRQGVANLNGASEVVGGIAIARQGSDTMAVLRNLKSRLDQLRASLPAGVEIVPVYDRSRLVNAAVSGFEADLLFTCLIVAFVIVVFLWDPPSVLVAVLSIPICLALSGLMLRFLHVQLNIATLTGLALSVGVLVDGAIIQVENVYHTMRTADADGLRGTQTIVHALGQVSPRVFLALLIIVVSFIPAYAFTGPEGRIFRPLVLAKTAVMLAAAFCAVLINPALRVVLARAWPTARPSSVETLMNGLSKIYERILVLLLPHPWVILALVALLIEFTIPSWMSLGMELLPPFEEGSRLFMPTTAPGISIAEAKALIDRQARALRSVPEVQTVFLKAGRADTVTDPAPLEMIEANVELQPEKAWRKYPRWYSDRVPEFLADHLLRPFWPDRITAPELQEELDRAVRMPGVVNAWTSPIVGRADMLASGGRTPLILKITGPSVTQLQTLSRQLRDLVLAVPGTSFAYTEPPQTGFFLDIAFNREKLSEIGLPLARAQAQLLPALGGITATTIYEHSIPRSVYVRYPSDYRDTIDALRQLAIEDTNGNKISVGSIASIEPRSELMSIRSEGGQPANYVYIDAAPANMLQYTAQLQKALTRGAALPFGYAVEWSGRVTDAQQLHARLLWIVPLTLGLIAALLWIGTGSLFYTLLAGLAVPLSLTGSVWLMSLLHYKLSAASWIGLLALLGLDAETGIFMLLFLDLAWKKRLHTGIPLTTADIQETVIEGAARRLRPKLMTVLAAFCGLLPIFLSQAAGADFMRHLIAPICGGLISSFALELLVYPVVFFAWRRRH